MNVSGQIHVSMQKGDCYGGRRIHLRIEGLPGWLMSILAEANAYKVEGSTYNMHQDGPFSILLGSERVVAVTEPAPIIIPKEAPEPAPLPGEGSKP